LSLSQTISLIHCSCFFLSNMEEVVWGNESSVGVLLGLVIVLCFFDRSRGIGVGDVEWNVFCFTGCFIAATLASSANGDDVEGGCGSWLISRGIGSKWKSFMLDPDPEDRIFVINWDHDCFVVDINGIFVSSWSPGGPVISDIKVSMVDECSKEIELVTISMHVDEDNAVIGTQGEDGRGGKSCAGEFMVD